MADPQLEQPGSGEDVAALLAAAANGDQQAWADIVQRYGRRVFALAKSRCRQTHVAEEITQSVFATVAAKLSSGGYAEQGRFEPWLFRVAMNRIRDEMRRRRRQADVVDPAALGAVAGHSEAADPELPTMLHRLREAMAELSEADREVLELRHHGGMSFREMADVLDQPLGTLLARHHRALRKLKQLMGDDEE